MDTMFVWVYNVIERTANDVKLMRLMWNGFWFWFHLLDGKQEFGQFSFSENFAFLAKVYYSFLT